MKQYLAGKCGIDWSGVMGRAQLARAAEPPGTALRSARVVLQCRSSPRLREVGVGATVVLAISSQWTSRVSRSKQWWGNVKLIVV